MHFKSNSTVGPTTARSQQRFEIGNVSAAHNSRNNVRSQSE
jgi:hypothetical protein